MPVQATRGEDAEMYAKHVGALAEWGPDITLDDGADLLMLLHRWERPVQGRRGGDHAPGCCACAGSRPRASSPAR